MRGYWAVTEQIFRGASGSLISGLCAATASGLILLIWDNPWATMLVGVAICVSSAGIYLMQRPLKALYLAIFLSLLPQGLRIEPIYTVVSNLAVAIALLAWVGQWLLRRERIHWNATWLLVGAYIIFGLISLLWAPDLIEGRRKAVAYIIGFILLFLIINQIRTFRSADGLMAALRGIGWVIVAGGLLEIASGNYQPGQRISIFEINQNQLVMILLLLVPSFAWPVLRSSGGRRKYKILSSITFGLCAFVFIMLSGSRGGALSLAVLMAGLLFSRQVRPWALLAVVMIIGTIIAAPAVFDTMTQRFEDPEGGNLGGRDLLWEAGLLLIKDHPWNGVGLGGGPLELPKYVAVLTGDPFLNSKRVLQSHNPLLEVGADTGIFGMVLYGTILLSALWQAMRQRSLSSGQRIISFYRPLILIVTAAYFLSWIKSGGVENNPTIFLLLGLLNLPALVNSSISQEQV